MRTFASIAVAYLLAAAVLWSAFGHFARAGLRRGVDPQLAGLVAIIGVGLIGYLAFFLYVLSPTLGLVCSIAACCGLIAALLWRRSLDSGTGNDLPFALALLFGLFYLSCAFLFIPQKVPGLPNLLFFELIRSGDNDGPMAFAHAVYKRVAATGSVNGEWYFSDRPPLQAGFDLFFTPLRGLFGNDDAHQAVGTLLQTSILAALWLLGAALRLRRREILLAVLTIGGTGFVFYNSIYVWPKLLAATFFLAVLIPIARAFLDKRRLTTPETLVIAAASALAMLSHGAAVFSLIALSILLAVMVTKFFRLRTFALAAITAATIYAPWAGYTHFVDPNMNRLLKMHLTDGDNLSSEPFLPMLIRSYRDITLERWLAYRRENISIMLGDRDIDRIMREVAARLIDPDRPRDPVLNTTNATIYATRLSDDVRSLVSAIRSDQREHVFRAFGLLNLAWLTLLLVFRPRWRDRVLDRGFLGLTALTVVTVAVWIVLQFNPRSAINTHASYAMLVITMLMAVVLLARTSPALARAVCCANIALSFILWVLFLPGPALTTPVGINWLALVTGILAGAGICVITRRGFSRAESGEFQLAKRVPEFPEHRVG
jgi:hypothetical protein